MDRTRQLRDALQDVEGIRVRGGGTCHRWEPEPTLCETRDAAAIEALVSSIEVDEARSGFHCMCCGDPTFEFLRKGEVVVSLGFHHGESLRWPEGRWEGGSSLTEGSVRRLLDWLEARGIDGPKRQHAEALRQRELWIQSERRFLAAMPPAFGDVWIEYRRQPLPLFRPETARRWDELLRRQIPEAAERIRTLLSWFGSGRGPWSGYPGYEQIPEQLLLLYETREILGAIGGRGLRGPLLERTARFFGSSGFGTHRKADLGLLTPGLKRTILAHALASTDEDKRQRARAAFGG